MGRILFYLLLIFLSIQLLVNCTDSIERDSAKNDFEMEMDSATIRAMANYQTYCSSCHGEQMYAFADRTWKYGNTKDNLIQSISNGFVDAGMPKWSAVLSESEIEELADYIRKGIDHVAQYGFEKVAVESDTFITKDFSFSLDTVVSGLENPWGMVLLPTGEMLVTEKKGILYLVNKKGEKTVIEGSPKVRDDAQGGLLDIILHPDFEKNHWLYISYSDFINDGENILSGTAIDRYTFKNNRLTEKHDIFRGKPYTKEEWHYGSRMAFDKDNYLFFTASDRAIQTENPQTLKNPKGKIHRVFEDGSIPKDNPFYGQADAVPSIYSYGHRNVQGLIFNKLDNQIWAHEHGPRGGDELNLIKPGANYGWPVISYGINYDGTTFTNLLEKEGMEQPVHYWVPSIAPCGMAVVTSDKYPKWKGDILIGSLRFNYLNRCIMDGNKVVGEENLMKNIGRLRNVIQGADGYIYFSVENPGYVFKIVPMGK